MKIKSTFSNRLISFFDTNKELREYLPFVLAKRVAYDLPMPSLERTSDYKHFYISNCEPIVSGVISDLNEKFVFDTKEASKITYVLWNTRYQLLYNPASIDFLHLLKSARTGLVAPETIKRLHKHDNIIGEKNLAILDNIIGEETVEF